MRRQTTTAGGRPSGFTLVELLVVIALIGTLMGLLLPAIQMARERGRMVTCLNNAKNLALACIQYENSKGRFMGHRQYMRVPDPSGGSGSIKVSASWALQALPFLGRTDIYEAFQEDSTALADPNDPNAWPYLEVMVCPSDTAAISQIGSPVLPVSYAVNGGRPDQKPSAGIQLDYKENGVFHDHVYNPGTKVSVAFISKHDGTANTILLAEKLAADIEPRFGGPSQWFLREGTTSRIVSERNNVLVWYRVQSPSTAPLSLTVKQCAPDQNGNPPSAILTADEELKNGTNVFMRPSSNHGGFHIAFCDGRVKFLSDDMLYTLYARLMTPYGRKCKKPAQPKGKEVLTYDPKNPNDAYRWVTNIVSEAELQ